MSSSNPDDYDSIHEILMKKFKSDTSVDNEKVFKNELKLEKILNNDTKSKQICLQCTYESRTVILILEKSSFSNNIAEKIVDNFNNVLKSGTNLFRNDLFGSYLVDLKFEDDLQDENLSLNKIFLQLIHPASERILEKYIDKPKILFRETYDYYQKETCAKIKKIFDENPDHIQWVYNILDGKAEKDRVIYRCPEFLMVKDMKWKCDNQEDSLTDLEKYNLYINAFVIRRDLNSLRDLNDQHLSLLESIYEDGRKAIEDKYSIPKDQIRVFIHYLPSFYHLHVHFTHIKNEGYGFQCERAHLLSTVIENIKLIPDYYQKITLEYNNN